MEQNLSEIQRRAARTPIQLKGAERHEEIKRIEHNAHILINFMEQGIVLITAHEMKALLDQAEEAQLVSRPGMRKSGLSYAIHEHRLLTDHATVSIKDGLETLRHIQHRAQRALNIIRNPYGYTPRQCGALYGGTSLGELILE